MRAKTVPNPATWMSWTDLAEGRGAIRCDGWVVRVAGLEPAAYRLGGGRSIRLSYTRMNDDLGRAITLASIPTARDAPEGGRLSA